MIQKGDTVGTFQIESRAQIQSILQTKPDRLYDIVVQVALIRPGPIQAKFVHPYTERRQGREAVTYPHPHIEHILRRTYGVPIFQEQAMAIAMVLGGFSAAEADELRRAMGHQRKRSKLEAALEKLRHACIARGVSETVANQVVDDLLSFANYGFPESHAWSFALIAYATAWLKSNYPTEFFLGLLNAWPMGFYPPSTLVHDALRRGVVVRPPCMKVGQWDCTLESEHPSPTRTPPPDSFDWAGKRIGEGGGGGGGGGEGWVRVRHPLFPSPPFVRFSLSFESAGATSTVWAKKRASPCSARPRTPASRMWCGGRGSRVRKHCTSHGQARSRPFSRGGARRPGKRCVRRATFCRSRRRVCCPSIRAR